MPEGNAYELVIGLEVHIQLLTRAKLFCADSTGFGAPPNTQVSAISLAHPGTLPRLNREVIPMAIRLGLATHCSIARTNFFARKHYFYPDLPKGYQLSQHTVPICSSGYLTIGEKNIRINRIHLEEDAGKSMHGDAGSLIDYNRAGTPLLELVTEPEINSGDEVAAFVTRLRQLVRTLGISDGDMEKGNLRCDVNLSVRPAGEKALGTRVEIKNLNSTRFMRKAVEFEATRLIALHRNGQPIVQETRGFDESTGTTYSIRVKEEAEDYRYFADPDLPPFEISEALIASLAQTLPPPPHVLEERLRSTYALSQIESRQLAATPELVPFFEELARLSGNSKGAFNWTTGPVRSLLNSREVSVEESGINPPPIAALIKLIEASRISHRVAVHEVLPKIAQQPALDIEAFIEENGLLLVTDEGALEGYIQEALEKHAQKITEYKKGKKGLISLFVGEVMKKTGGKGDAALITQKIIEKIKNS